MSGHILCLDLGGSKVAWGVMTRSGALLWRQSKPWQPAAAHEVLEALTAIAKEVLLGPGAEHITAVGLTIPGPCDPATGTWLAANFADIRDFPITRLINERLNLPAYGDNDGKACALAEKLLGAGRGIDDFVYLTVSNGIGGGVVSGGMLLRGSGHYAGEIGHCVIMPDGRPCACGGAGCLEAYAAGPGLKKTSQEMLGRPLSGKELADLARAGDMEALKVWQKEGRYLGMGIAHAVTLLNPQRVIVGGGLSLAFDLYEDALNQSLKRHAFSRTQPFPRVMATPLGYDGGLCGAGAVVLSKQQ